MALSLTRQLNEPISINDEIKITVIKPTNQRVRLSIDAPEHIEILRS
jgi:carbon storage regulator CsrA